jgi:hypothetical protein
MKKITKIVAFIFSIMLLFNACDKMEDVHSEFLKDGDIIYAPKPLLPVVFGGKERVKLKYYLINAINVNKCIIEWNEGAESHSVDIAPNVPIDSIEVIIDNLNEQSYIFKVHTIDNSGNRSVREQVTGSAYGTKYESALYNRALTGIEGGGTVDSLIINWGTATERNTGVKLMYNNGAGEPVEKMVPPEDDYTVIKDWESEGTMSYQSFYIPEVNAIDTFATETAETLLPVFIKFEGVKIDNSNWEIIDFSTEEPAEGAPNGLASAAIDGDLNTYWHTQWSGGSPGYPHHFTVDLKDLVKINKIECFRRQGDNRGQTEFQIHTSLDGTNFTNQGTFAYDPNSASQAYNLSSLPMARYVKYIATSGPNFFAFLAELDIYGQVASKIDQSTWSIAGFSSEEPAEANWGPPIQGLAAAAIDGDLSTFWHSAWNESQPDYPHYFIVDMQTTVRMLGIECFRRQGNGNGQTKFKIYTSDDGVTFTEQGVFDFNSQIDDGQLYPMGFLPEARYFKYEAIEGPNHYAFLAEINVYGSPVN